MTLKALIPIIAMLPAGGAVVAQEPGEPPRERPAWVVDGVPNTVWLLVEASRATDDDGEMKDLLKGAETHARASAEGHEDDVGRRFALAVVLIVVCYGFYTSTLAGRSLPAATDL